MIMNNSINRMEERVIAYLNALSQHFVESKKKR
jgi:hypothetical protein